MDEITPWELAACIIGWNKSQGGGEEDKAGPPTNAEFDQMLARHGLN